MFEDRDHHQVTINIGIAPETLDFLKHLVGGFASTLARIESKLALISGNIKAMNTDLDQRNAELKAAVEAETTVDESAITLLNGLTDNLTDLKAKLLATGVTPEQLAALDEEIAASKASTEGLAAAVTANTPASPPPPPPASLSVSPSTANFSVGDGTTPSSVTLSISGGVGPYVATGLPGGVTFDGSALNADGTQTAGTTNASLADSSTPPISGSVTVVVG